MPDLGSDGYWEAFALHAGGDLFHYHSSTKLNPVHLTGDFHAIGSGAEYVLGAMASGKIDVQAAIEIVSLYDVTTNDVVTSETWNNGKKGDIVAMYLRGKTMCKLMATKAINKSSEVIGRLSWHDILDIQMFIVFILYFTVMLQLYKLIKPLIKEGVKGAKSLLFLMIVFGQCAITGYLLWVLGAGIETMVVMHAILIVFTALYIGSGQQRLLIKALTDD